MGTATHTPKTAPNLTRSSLRPSTLQQSPAASKSAQPSRTRPHTAASTDKLTTPNTARGRHSVTPSRAAASSTPSKQQREEEEDEEDGEEPERNESVGGIRVVSGERAQQQQSAGQRDEGGEEDEQHQEEEEGEEDKQGEEEDEDAGSGPDEDRQPLSRSNKPAARRNTRRQSAPATLARSTASTSTTASTPAKRDHRATRQPPATTAKKAASTTSRTKQSPRKSEEQAGNKQQLRQAAEAEDSAASPVKSEQEVARPDERNAPVVKDERKSPRLRSHPTPASTSTPSTGTARKRSQSPLPPARTPATPATSSSANKRQRVSRASKGTEPVICSVLPDVTLLCDDVVNATFDILEDEVRRERERAGSDDDAAAEGRGDTAAGAGWVLQVEQAVTDSLNAGLEQCERNLQANVWSVPADVEERATKEVAQRPKHSQAEVAAIEAELADLRQQIVNVSTASSDRRSMPRRQLHLDQAFVLLTGKRVSCVASVWLQQRYVRQQLEEQSQRSTLLASHFLPRSQRAPPTHGSAPSHSLTTLLRVRCVACLLWCVRQVRLWSWSWLPTSEWSGCAMSGPSTQTAPLSWTGWQSSQARTACTRRSTSGWRRS